MTDVDIAIIGAGVIGLAIAAKLSGSQDLSVVVIERNAKFGQEISSRNSEVIHSGIYYHADCLKSQLCVRGNRLLYDYCAQHRVSHQACGKLVIAVDEREGEMLDTLRKHVEQNEVPYELCNQRRLRVMEPAIAAHEAILLKNTGIINAHELMRALYLQAKEQAADFLFGSEVAAIEYTGKGYIIETQQERFTAAAVINGAGLSSEKIAAMVGINIKQAGYRLHLCKGEYFRIKRKLSISHLVYPVPNRNSLGIHLSRDNQGGLRLGPNAFYVDDIDYSVDENHGPEFYDAASRYIPGLRIEDITPDFSGIRPKLQGPDEDHRDFVIREECAKGFPRFINLVGIESPGLTSCLAIAEYVERLVSGIT